ncbi:hypothetical protein [Streptomyces macrosporus]|uniref:Uncharacterized protein n=1 Tax=Streptomyces macrosporus TaxID=44032 RepID=A0ABN3KHV9_9ACTN
MAEQDLRDYGTPEERAERQAAARGQLADARRNGNQQAGTPGRRPTR